MSMPMVRIHAADDVRLDQVEIPQVGTDDVLIDVSLCGICGSDLSYIAMGGLGVTQPMPLGHELVGKVAKVGDNVKHVQVGDQVVVNPMASGNSIGNGGPEGAFAPHLLVRDAAQHEAAVLKVPAQLSAEQSALVEPLSVAMHGCHQGNVSADDTAVVMGAGPIGLCTVVCLQYLGVKNIVAVDLSDYRLAVAQKLGANIFSAGSGDLAQFLQQQHGSSELMGMSVPGSDVYFEATGAGPVFDQIVNTAKTGARVVVLGVHKKTVELDLVNVLFRELKITGSMAYPNEFPEVIEMLSSGEVDVEPLISHRFPLSDFAAALAQAKDPSATLKVIVECQN